MDLDDLFTEVFGDDDSYLRFDTKDTGDDYGAREKDEMEYIDEDSEEYGESEVETDYEGE